MADETLYVLTERDAKELRRIMAKIDNVTGRGVTNRADGISIAPPPPTTRPTPRPESFFVAVRVEVHDGGPGGNVPLGSLDITKATWTYKLRKWSDTLGEDLPFVEGVPVKRPRPNAPMLAQSGKVGMGIAYKDNALPGGWALWDAGEVIDLTTCALTPELE